MRSLTHTVIAAVLFWSAGTDAKEDEIDMTTVKVVPYADLECRSKLEYKYTNFGAEQKISEPFSLGPGPQISHNHFEHNDIQYENLEFVQPGKNTSSQTLDTVWWYIPEMPKSCRAVFMKPWPDNFNYGYVGKLPGSVVMNAGKSGCMPTQQMGVETQLQMTFCCGKQLCEPFSLGEPDLSESSDSSLLPADPDLVDPKDPDLVDPDLVSRDLVKNVMAFESQSKERSIELERTNSDRVGSAAARANSLVYMRSTSKTKKDNQCGPDNATCWRDYINTCEIQKSRPRIAPGQQVVVGSILTCTSQADGERSWESSKSITVSTEFTSSRSEERSESHADSTSANAGVGFEGLGVGFETSVTDEWGMAITSETGQSLGREETFELTETMSPLRGSTAMLTFTPRYQCISVDLTCPEDQRYYITSCEPYDSREFKILYTSNT